MSAAVVWEDPTTSPVPSSRPRLVLVPTGDAVPSARSRALRITRRGRLALSLAAAVVLLAVAGFALTRALAAPAAPMRSVVVPSGSTLSQVAARELPDRSVAQGVADLERVNGLASDQVSAGQVLLVPAA